MKKIKLFILSLGLVFSFGLATLPLMPAYAAVPLTAACDENPDATICKNRGEDFSVVLKRIINTLLFLVGVIAVGMIIYSGLRYSASMGDAANITKAKNMLMYSIVGLVVALLAFPIVSWVIDALT